MPQGEIVEDAGLADLNPDAVAFARVQYQQKHPQHAPEVDTWDDSTFLNKAKVFVSGRVTRAALLLLGKTESGHFLSPAQARITWVLRDEKQQEKDYEHFDLSFILAGDKVLQKIRNLTVRHLPSGTLFPHEVTQYDTWVIREILHNCIAHQDYSMAGRINVVETPDTLLFTNLGSFLPGTVEEMIRSDAPPEVYRNPFLAHAMVTEQHCAKRTVKRFGEYIDTYKLMDSVRDGATLQILYEGRTADTALKDKHGFDTKFEDLFRERTEAELAEIKKKYGATGDILEAEKRIGAIARDLVDHYVDNILPDRFKAQVVCHSKLAAVRYQKAIREALAERLDREWLKQKPDEELIRRVPLLKVAMVVSADPTNELAQITEARKEAKRWNAVENFCKPFDFDDPDKALTGIAFLVVCDMLLTGFDAPIEQVMYIDKRLYEHNLLQAIARVNRVAAGKQRGFIVDYIGLANHLGNALAIYTEEDAQDIRQGLKSILTELPILEERYQRLLQHFRGVGVADIEPFVTGTLANSRTEVAVLHAAVGAMKDIKPRADFEVYLKKFLQSLNLILPHESGHRFRGPARRFGYLLRMVKERYKDDSLDLSDAGEKVKALINEHLIDLGVNPRIPPIELLSPGFMEHLEKHSGGDQESKASEMEHAIRKHCTVHFDEDPAFYRRLSDKLERLIQEQKENWEVLSKEYESLRREAQTGRTDVVEGLTREASTFYDYVVQLAFNGGEVPVEHRQGLKGLLARIVEILQDTIGIIDFWKKPIEVKKLRGNIDTEILLADLPQLADRHERIAVEIVKLAEKRHSELTR